MMTQRGRRQVDMRLDLARRSAAFSPLNDEAENGQPHGMAESAELLSMTIEFRGHEILLINSKEGASPISSILEEKVIPGLEAPEEPPTLGAVRRV